MLTHEDFEGIGRVVENKIQELVPPIIKVGVKAGIDDLEARMDLKFDAVQEQLDELRTDVDGLRTDVNGLRTDVDGLRTDVDGLRTDVDGVKGQLDDIKGQMVTKTYLDERLEHDVRRSNLA